MLPLNLVPAGANKADGARLDASARNVWNPLETWSFLDVKVFHTQAPA